MLVEMYCSNYLILTLVQNLNFGSIVTYMGNVWALNKKYIKIKEYQGNKKGNFNGLICPGPQLSDNPHGSQIKSPCYRYPC